MVFSGVRLLLRPFRVNVAAALSQVIGLRGFGHNGKGTVDAPADGFSTIPSTMPLVLSIIDDLSNGRPASMTYLDLWTRAFDEGFVTLAKPREMAFHSGFTTQRAERTWRQKLDVLAELGFIDLKSGPNGPASYALLRNPYLVIKRHHEEKNVGLREDKFNALVARALEIGDRTFAPPVPAPVPVTITPPPGFFVVPTPSPKGEMESTGT